MKPGTIAVAFSLWLMTDPSYGQIAQALIDHQAHVAITEHTGTFGGQAVAYTATVEEHILNGPDNVPNAFLVTIAYVRNGITDTAKRPVVFAFNGGPGASSSPLHFSGIGPHMNSQNGVIDNPNSILDVADLVFIDPVGTGFSRPYTTEAGKEFYWNLNGDAASVKKVIDLWLEKYGRDGSPRYLIGESYGTTRIGAIFKNHKDARFEGVVLVSGVGGINSGREISHVILLPTMSASAWFHEKISRNGRTVEEVWDEAVNFARTEYLIALFRGSSLPAEEKKRVAGRVSSLVGLPAEFIEQKDLRVSKEDWMLNVLKDKNLRTAEHDTRVTTSLDPKSPGALNNPTLGLGKPKFGTAGLRPAIVPGSEAAAAAQAEKRTPRGLEAYLTEELQFKTLESYRSLNLDINPLWKLDFASLEVADSIGVAMRANPGMRLLWIGGFYDLATPAYGAQYSYDQAGIPADRITAGLVAGQHTVFGNEQNREKLTGLLRNWIR